MSKKRKYLNWLSKKQSQQESAMPSTQTNTENVVSYLHQQQPGTQSNYLLHRDIKTLIYEDFLQVLVSGELAALIISGKPPIDELVSAWDNITEQYSSAIHNQKARTIFECYKKIVSTQTNIQIIQTSLQLLTIQYDEDIAGIIHNMGYSLILPIGNKKKYAAQLASVEMQAKTMIIKLVQYQNEYKILSPAGTEVKLDYQSYVDELAVLSKFQGYAIRTTQITVAEYCSIINNFIKSNQPAFNE